MITAIVYVSYSLRKSLAQVIECCMFSVTSTNVIVMDVSLDPMVTTSLNIQGHQVHTIGIIRSKQEMHHLRKK